MDSGANRATLAVNGVTGAGTGVVKDFTAYSLATNFKIGSTLGTNTGAGQINDEWKIYTTLVSCADDYTAWNNAAPTWNGTLAVAASRWYGAKTQGGSRVALAANNTTITLGQTSAVAYVGQTNCTVDYCSQISQRLYYTCAACPSAGSELPVPDTPTADGISFYGATSEYGVLAGDHGTALTGSPTLKSGGT